MSKAKVELIGISIILAASLAIILLPLSPLIHNLYTDNQTKVHVQECAEKKCGPSDVLTIFEKAGHKWVLCDGDYAIYSLQYLDHCEELPPKDRYIKGCKWFCGCLNKIDENNCTYECVKHVPVKIK